MASKTVAYVLWFFGGWFGLHHFYLKRDRHAFVWWSTLGGVFGVGWVRDSWRIPDYVQQCNEDEVFYKKKKERHHVSKNDSRSGHSKRKNGSVENKKENELQHYQETVSSRTENGPENSPQIQLEGSINFRTDVPKWSFMRFSGELIMGNIFSYLFRLAVPEEYAELDGLKWVVLLLPPLGAALGTHLVANIGRERCSLIWPLIGAYVTLPLLGYDIQNIASSPLVAAIFTNWKGKRVRREPPPRKGLCKRLTILSCCGIVYLLLVASTVYFNASITINNEESVPLREAVRHFFKSPAWANTKEQFHQLYNYYNTYGWHKLWDQILAAFDASGEVNAYKVLELNDSCSQEEITKHYRALSRKWHPDRQKDPQKKTEAQEKFIEIQQAYEILSQIRAKRTKRSKESTKNERTEF